MSADTRDTTRTDAAKCEHERARWFGSHAHGNHPPDGWEFARTLERELAAKAEEVGSNADAPDPNGSVYALKNWWKLKCDERDELLVAKAEEAAKWKRLWERQCEARKRLEAAIFEQNPEKVRDLLNQPEMVQSGDLTAQTAAAEGKDETIRLLREAIEEEAIDRAVAAGAGMLKWKSYLTDKAHKLLQDLKQASPSPWRDVAWRSMGTAPLDGTEVDLWGLEVGDSFGLNPTPRRFCGCKYVGPSTQWSAGYWWHRNHGNLYPTHWMPSPPAPPTPQQSNDGEESSHG